MFNIDPEELVKLPGQVTVYWLDKNERLLGCNDYLKKILPYSYEEIKGKNVLELQNLKEEEALVCHAANQFVLANLIPKQIYEFYTCIKTNTRTCFNTLKMPLFATNNKLVGIIGVSHVVKKEYLDKTHRTKQELSKKEEECMRLLILGNTAKEIALILNLSSRTVEHYLDNAKIKLGSTTRSQLIQKFLLKVAIPF